MNVAGFLHTFSIISTLFGILSVLIFEKNFGFVESKQNLNYLKDFSGIVDGLADGLKTVAKVAQIISGEVDPETRDECKFICNNGAVPRRRINYVPEDNGCGAYGLKVDLSKLPQMERCCSKHDKCYSHCGMDKEDCDVHFLQCLENVCTTLLHSIGLNDQETEGCIMTVQLMYHTVLELGCQAYLDGQNEACICQLHPDDTGRKPKQRTNMEL